MRRPSGLAIPRGLRGLTPVLSCCIALALGATGCHGTPLWVPGLTLTDDSKILDQLTTSRLSPQLAAMPDFGEVDKVLSISIGGPTWEDLTAHVQTCLASQGLEDETDEMVPVLARAGSDLRGDDILKATRLYRGDRSRYVVMLLDLQQIAQDSPAHQPFSLTGLAAGPGQFTLSVIKLK